MNALERMFRFLSPKRYCLWGLNRAERQRSQKLKAAKSLSQTERYNLISELDHEVDEWEDWKRAMDDRELARRARKMDVYLEDIPFGKRDQTEMSLQIRPSHFHLGPYGNELLHDDSRAALTRAVHERAPAYRKERRERLQLWINFLALLIGLVGAATALVTTILRK